MLSPKGEFLKELEEGSLWFECLSLPWVIKNFFSHPRRTYQKIGLYCADGRADGRAYLVFVQYLFPVLLLFFTFFLIMYRIVREQYQYKEKSVTSRYNEKSDFEETENAGLTSSQFLQLEFYKTILFKI